MAGIPDPYVGSVERQPKGGRDPLVRRMARKLAAYAFRHVQPTGEELAALEEAVRVGAESYTMSRYRWRNRWPC